MRTGRKLAGALASLFASVLLYDIDTCSALGMPLQCTANANVTPLVRAEGITERVADVILSCIGGMPIDPGVSAPKADIYISLNTSVTSRILNPDNRATDVLLIIDEPPEAEQKACVVGTTCNVVGVGAYAIGPYLPPGAYNIWQGTLADPNVIAFYGVPIAPPGTNGGTLVFRVTNIRADATSLGSEPNAPSRSVTATVFVAPSTILTITNPQQTVGLVANGLITTVKPGNSFQQCLAVAVGNVGNGGWITFQEGYPAAFKTRTLNTSPATAGNDIGPPYQDTLQNSGLLNTESAFYNELISMSGSSGGNLYSAGLADFGTRLSVKFHAVPNGASVVLPLKVDNFAATAPNSPTLTLVLINGTSGPYTPAGSGIIALDAHGDGEAIYEVVQDSSSVIESVTIPITVSYISIPSGTAPALGTSTVSGSFAPLGAAPFSPADTYPLFVDTSVSQPAFSINVCPPPTLSVDTPNLTFNYLIGVSSPPAQDISVSSTYPTIVSATKGTGCTWLTLSSATGLTPASIVALANPNGLPPGNYTCPIQISAPNAVNGGQAVNVTLAITQATKISVGPSSILFAFRLGSSAPAAQTIAITSNSAAAVSFVVASGADCGWLELENTTGVTPAFMRAWVNTTDLTSGSHTCTLTITAAAAINSPQTVQVSLEVSDRPILNASPSLLTFNSAGPGQQPKPQSVFLFTGAPVDVSAMSTDKWLSLSFSSATTPAILAVSVNVAGLTPGSYQGRITIDSPAANPASRTLMVTLNVGGPHPPAFTPRREQFAFSFTRAARQPQMRYVTIARSGIYHAASDSPWLTVVPSDGTVDATPATLSIVADPSGLAPQTYTGTVTVSSPQAGTLVHASVTMTVNENEQWLTVSQTGLSFAGLDKGGMTNTQTLYILKGSGGPLNWTMIPSTLSGGNWLSASPSSGVLDSSPAAVKVQVDTNGLAPGDYYGQLLTSADAANSPQLVGVRLTVTAGPIVPPLVDPAGLIFADSGRAPQSISITNRGASVMHFESSAFFDQGHAWFTAEPASGVINAGETLQINVRPSSDPIQPGTLYTGELNLGFGDNSAERINLIFVAPPATAPASQPQVAQSCTPTSLIPLITSVGGDATVSLGRPMAVEAKVVDNCGGTPQGTGSIQLDFSNGDPSVALVPLPGGIWTGTFTPKTAGPAPFEIVVQGRIGGQMAVPYTLPLSIGPASLQPLILPQGISSVASYAPEAPIAPGSLINIYGSRFADQPGSSPSSPLLTQIADTRVLLANRELPLLYASPDRIIAQVPFEISINTEQQLVVQKGVTQSAQETLAVAPAQPAIFTVNQQGTGQAAVTVGNSSILADVAHPVKPGDTIVIYCAGLGSLSPQTETGYAAPVNPLSRTAVPAVTIGGKSAQVSFSGLTPAFVGLYQVNAVVPTGVLGGSNVPLVVSVLGQTSPPVTIAVQ